jgi:ATP-dependent DNA ligase
MMKYDGWRAIAHHEGATLDGELVCLDSQGRSQFWGLLWHRGEPHYPAFDIMELDGRDLTQLRLIQRKAILRRLIPRGGPVLYVSHIEGSGVELFRKVSEMDLEGIVAKWKAGTYNPAISSWVKIVNENYSQHVGRSMEIETAERMKPRILAVTTSAIPGLAK